MLERNKDRKLERDSMDWLSARERLDEKDWKKWKTVNKFCYLQENNANGAI